MIPSAGRAQAPVFEIAPVESTIKFDVEASLAIRGKFDKWDATMTMTSPALSTAVLDIKIQAASVDTGSGIKNGKLKSKDFFDVEHNPSITFHSTKVEQTGPNTIVFDGDSPYLAIKHAESQTGKLEILKAVYGKEGSGQDVTERLQKLIKNNTLDVKVSNITMGGDPNKGADKTLKVDYTYRGQRKQVVVKEGDRLQLP